MDSFFDNSFLKLIVPIIIVFLFSLPDLLRKRRKYPPKQRPVPPQPEKEKVDTTVKNRDITKPEDLPDIAKPRRPKTAKPLPAPVEAKTETEEERPSMPEAEPTTEPEVQKIPAAKPIPVPQAAAITPQPTAAATAATPHIVHGKPWGELAPEARDIYAGLVWSELLSAPVSLRQKQNRNIR